MTIAAMMIALVVLALLCCQQVTSAAVDDAKSAVASCVQETGITVEEMNTWVAGGNATEKAKCQMKCVMMKTKTLTDDGHLKLGPMLELLPEEQHAAATECLDIDQGGELCDVAYRHQRCMRDKSPMWYADWIKGMIPSS